MRHMQTKDKLGATRGKLALVGLLALTLVGVVVKQLPESPPERASLEQTSAQAKGNSETSLASADSENRTLLITDKGREQSPLWPESNLAETLANNPFALPSWAKQEKLVEVEESSQTSDLAELQEQGATIVVIANGEKSATIGENRYFVGDVLAGFRVTDITTQGILLDKL